MRAEPADTPAGLPGSARPACAITACSNGNPSGISYSVGHATARTRTRIWPDSGAGTRISRIWKVPAPGLSRPACIGAGACRR